MKRYFAIALMALAVVALVALAGCSSSTPPASSSGSESTVPAGSSGGSSSSAAVAQAVDISNFAFTPADLTVKVGDTVTWTNSDSVAHTITFADFDSGQVAPGATYSHTFDKAGTFDYKCSIHPQMTGKVTVQ